MTPPKHSDHLIRIAALYRFTRFDDPAALREPLLKLCKTQAVRGTLLLAHEGINGTIAGSNTAINKVIEHICTLPGCADLDVKNAWTDVMPFYRIKLKVKPEIVTMGRPDIDALTGAGHYIVPENWNALIDEPDTILIDTRNDYEVSIGSFANAINPRTLTFRDFPAWFRQHREALLATKKAPKIAMFCTGGIRCEKATAFLKAEGLDEVYHLKGGILKYLETIPAEQSRWQGECFVFDQRVSVQHGLLQGNYDICHACRMPLSAADKTSHHYIAGISCPACHEHLDETRRAGYSERQRQIKLGKQRGTAHIGQTWHMPADDTNDESVS
jgi:UPF0176 protein